MDHENRNIGSSQKRGQESREIQEELIFLLFEVGTQTQKQKGK